MTGQEARWAGLGPEDLDCDCGRPPGKHTRLDCGRLDCGVPIMNEMPIIRKSECRMCQAKDSRIEFLTKEVMRLNAELNPTRLEADRKPSKRGLPAVNRAAFVSTGEYKARIDCLSMFVRRLYRKLRKYEPDAEVINQANTYLKAIGQAGTPLKAEESQRDC